MYASDIYTDRFNLVEGIIPSLPTVDPAAPAMPVVSDSELAAVISMLPRMPPAAEDAAQTSDEGEEDVPEHEDNDPEAMEEGERMEEEEEELVEYGAAEVDVDKAPLDEALAKDPNTY